MEVLAESSKFEEKTAWSPEEFEEQLRQKVIHYHTEHPFHKAMIDGVLTRKQIQGWVANRFYYQQTIPRKDAAILANCPLRDFRRKWLRRITDQDGLEGNDGGLEGWIRLGQACGLSRQDIVSLKLVRPGVRFACDAYLNFAKQAPWQEAVCSSLTELFAHNAHKQRIESFPHNYPWIEEEGLSYFKQRLKLVETDVKHGLSITLEHFNTYTLQQRALQILGFKLDILWEILDSIQMAYGIGDDLSS
ncbi:MAG: pyrroloquinoline-quinone synthase PqqC [Oligoflexus sp.]